MKRRLMSAAGALVVLMLVAGVVLWRTSGGVGATHLTVYFPRTDGIYAGDEVRVLGVPVGRIESIKATDDEQVRVELSVDHGVQIPQDAKAVIVAPSLISSRYIQLTPRYDGGKVLASGSTIPIDRTAVPVEWDSIKAQLNDLVVALGPDGANKSGALRRFVDSSSRALDGQGAGINTALANLSGAITTLDNGGDDLFSVIRNLQTFVSALRQSDDQIGEFTERLDTVSTAFAGDRTLVRTALSGLSQAVGEVDAFVRKNRGEISESLTRLADVSTIVAKRQADLAQILHVAPNALENLNQSYHQRQNAVAVDLHAANIHSPGQLICGAIGGAAGTSGQATADLCGKLIGDLLDQVANTPQVKQILEALLGLLAGEGK